MALDGREHGHYWELSGLLINDTHSRQEDDYFGFAYIYYCL